MEQNNYTQSAQLDAVFHALADGTRRAILSRLADGSASVNELAEPFEVSQPAISRHLKVLEQAGLIAREVDRQRRPARIRAETMLDAVGWLADFRPLWGTSFAQLDDLLIKMQRNQQRNPDHE